MTDEEIHSDTREEPLRTAISSRYLQYALSTIMHRALPDARDGLKPVQRRILFAMRELKLGPNSGFRKSAKISGDVMGNYHPHGDQAIYDALARLAQEFTVRYPLVDGQGNFGNIDGDKPASARYTEARLTQAAVAIMEGLDENAVDFQSNYDSTLEEPIVYPSSFPNLLANGSSGIAVGMATNIPPHNIGELCDASLHLIRYPNAGDDTIFAKVPGPDFPTGGVIVEPTEKIRTAYQTGRGQIRVRARWELERGNRGSWNAVVTEIPYQVQKSRLIENIAKLVQDKRNQWLSDVRDESAEDIRIVLEPRSRNLKPEAFMEALFKLTDLETRFSMNMNALTDGRTPRVCSLKEILRIFLQHRKHVLERRSRFRLDKIDQRLILLEGYIVAFLNLDRVIEIIRTEDDPKSIMVDEFDLLEVQAEAILNMRLRSLRRLEELELKREQNSLYDERAALDDLLHSDEQQWNKIAGELKETKKLFGTGPGKRRTTFATPPSVEEFATEMLAESEPVTVICSKMGWIRFLKGTIPINQEFKYRDGDGGKFVFHAETSDKLLLFGSNGRFYSIPVSGIPGGRGLGEPIRIMVELPNEANILALLVHNPDRKLLLASHNGFGFFVNESDAIPATRNGKQVFVARKDDRAQVCIPLEGDHIAIVGNNRQMLVIPASTVPTRSRGMGVCLQKYKQGGLSDVTSFDLKHGLRWVGDAGQNRTEKDVSKWFARRATLGQKAPYGFPRNNKFS